MGRWGGGEVRRWGVLEEGTHASTHHQTHSRQACMEAGRQAEPCVLQPSFLGGRGIRQQAGLKAGQQAAGCGGWGGGSTVQLPVQCSLQLPNPLQAALNCAVSAHRSPCSLQVRGCPLRSPGHTCTAPLQSSASGRRPGWAAHHRAHPTAGPRIHRPPCTPGTLGRSTAARHCHTCTRRRQQPGRRSSWSTTSQQAGVREGADGGPAGIGSCKGDVTTARRQHTCRRAS